MSRAKWAVFERLGDAIKEAERRGALVRWADMLSGLTFDATLRIRMGPYEYLIVVDCLDSEESAKERMVEAFAAKSKDVGARLAIMASASGYTPEAIDYATRNNIRLLTLDTIRQTPLEVLTDAFNLVVYAYNFRFPKADKTGAVVIPEEPEILSYFMREMKVEGPGINTVPEKLIEETREERARTVTSTPQLCEIRFPEGTVIIHPNIGDKTDVSSFAFIYRLMSACDIKAKDRLGSDPYGIGSTLRDELAKRNPNADPKKIEDDFDTVLEPGKYYYSPMVRLRPD